MNPKFYGASTALLITGVVIGIWNNTHPISVIQEQADGAIVQLDPGAIPIVRQPSGWGNLVSSLFLISGVGVAGFGALERTRELEGKERWHELKKATEFKPETKQKVIVKQRQQYRAIAPVAVADSVEKPMPEASVAIVLQPARKRQTKKNSGDWIMNLAEDIAVYDSKKRLNHSLQVCGPTQSGKSTLVAKLLELVLEKGGEVDLCLCDPKYPKSDWSIVPQFKGYESVIPALEHALSVLSERKQLCIDAEQRGEQHPDFERFILVLDEWDNIYSRGDGYGDIIPKKEAFRARNMLLRLIKEGAAYNVSVFLIGQSHQSAITGLSLSDFNNLCRIILKGEVLLFLESQHFQYQRFAEKFRGLAERYLAENKRFALVIPSGRSPELYEIPNVTVEKFSLNPVQTDIQAVTACSQSEELEDVWGETGTDNVIPFKRGGG